MPDWKVCLADTTVGDAEIAAVVEVLRSRWLSAGGRTQEFERRFAGALGVPAAVAVSSGTAALHLAVIALGIGPGDEVIVPSLSFVAAAAVVAMQGGTPVFADVRSETDLTIDPADVARLLSPRTRAVVAMHYGGHPADLAGLAAVVAGSGAALVEDAAHAPVVHAAGGVLGTVGDVGCFSFFATKNLTTGEGGMLVARDPELLARVRRLRSHAMTTSTWERDRSGAAGYDVAEAGLNYRPTEISSALGSVQLDRLPADRAARSALVAAYREQLADLPGLGLPFADRTGDSAHHLLAVTLPPRTDRAAVRDALTGAGVQSSVHYPPAHRFSYYARRFPTARLPVTDRVAPRLLSLPLHARMAEADVALVTGTLRAALLSARC